MGGSEAIDIALRAMLDPGDEVLIPQPSYVSYEPCTVLADGVPVIINLKEENDFRLTAEEVLSAVTDKTKILILPFPNNPTGSYVKPAEREAIVAMCRAHDVALIADEVFYDYALEPFDGNARLAGEPGVLTFALDGFSKMLAAPHAKVGWIQVSGPAEDVREALQRLDVIADDYLPMSDIIASRIPDLLEAAKVQTDLVRGRVQGNLRALHRMLESDPLGVVSVLRAEGGWNVLLRVPGVIDENELVLHMIDAHGVSGQPGYFFDMASNGYLAISLLPEPDEFAHNVRVVLDSVAELLG